MIQLLLAILTNVQGANEAQPPEMRQPPPPFSFMAPPGPPMPLLLDAPPIPLLTKTFAEMVTPTRTIPSK